MGQLKDLLVAGAARFLNGINVNGTSSFAGDANPSVTNTYSLGTSSLKWKNIYATTFNGALSGNATTASKWATARTISLGNDASGSVSLDGSANVTLNVTNTRLSSNSSTASNDPGGLTWFNIFSQQSATVDTNDTPSTSNTWWYILRNRHTNTENDFYTDIAIPFNANSIYYKRIAAGAIQNSTTNNGWVKVLDQLNYTDYTVTKTGSGASGTWGINVTGNAGSATKLQTARTIWGQSFDGTANISGNMTGVGNINTAAAPAGTVYMNNWFRSIGSTGWYSETYGGGWYMSDSSWIRTYGSKNIYQNTGITRTDGQFQVGDSGSKFYANSSGNGYFSNSLGIAGTDTSYNFYVNGTSYLNGNTIVGAATAASNNSLTLNGHMVINPSYNTSNSYSEGIRINKDTNNWSVIALGGDAGSTSGTSAKTWLIGDYDGVLYLSINGSKSAATRLQGDANRFRIKGTASSSANTSGQLIVQTAEDSAGGGNVALELWRGANASWQIANESGTLYIRNNYTTARQTTYSQNGLILDYNTGAASLPYLALGQASRNTSYRLYVNGTSYLKGATSINSSLYVATTSSLRGEVSFAYDATDQYLQYTGNLHLDGHGGRITLYTINPSGTAGTAGARKPKSIIWGNNGYGTIRLYKPDAKTYYSNASGSTANNFWNITANGDNLDFNSYAGGNSTTASSAYHIYFRPEGRIIANSAASSWLDGQRYQNAAYNVADINNTSGYFPWMRQGNSGSAKWFSIGTLNTAFYIVGSATSRTTNGYDYSWVFNLADGSLTTQGTIVPNATATHNIGSQRAFWRNGFLNYLLISTDTGFNTVRATAGKPGVGINGAEGAIDLSYTTPYIDFHRDNSTADYTVRIIDNTIDGIRIQRTGSMWVYITSGSATNSAGIYFSQQGGGIYMSDTTWIRLYNGKSFYAGSGTIRTDGGSVWSDKIRIVDNWIGWYATKGDASSTRYGYIQNDVSSNGEMRFCREQGGTFKFNSRVYINCITEATPGSESGALLIGDKAGTHLCIDANEIIPKASASTGGVLYLGDSAGSTRVQISGAFCLGTTSSTVAGAIWYS